MGSIIKCKIETKNQEIYKTLLSKGKFEAYDEKNPERGHFEYKNHDFGAALDCEDNFYDDFGLSQIDLENSDIAFQWLTVYSHKDDFHDEIAEISKYFPEEHIQCTYTTSADDFFKNYVYKYHNGDDKFVDFEYSPMPLSQKKLIEFFGEEHSEEIQEKVNTILEAVFDNKLIRGNEKIQYEFFHDKWKFIVKIPFSSYAEIHSYVLENEEWKEYNPDNHDGTKFVISTYNYGSILCSPSKLGQDNVKPVIVDSDSVVDNPW